MAKLMSIISTILVLVFVSGSLEIAAAQQSKYDIVIAICKRRIPIQPAQELYDYIFKNKTSVSNGACEVLVKAGQPCHGVLINNTLRKPEFKGQEVIGFLKRSDEIWNKCLSVADCKPETD